MATDLARERQQNIGAQVHKRGANCGADDDSFVICQAAYCGLFRPGISIGAVVCYPVPSA
jgi:hypothetical protein